MAWVSSKPSFDPHDAGSIRVVQPIIGSTPQRQIETTLESSERAADAGGDPKRWGYAMVEYEIVR